MSVVPETPVTGKSRRKCPDDQVRARVLDRMRRLCSRREYCGEDLRRKVDAAFTAAFPGEEDKIPALTDGVLEELRADRYYDDLRYATAFARDKSSLSGWGAAKISHALAAKRVDRETIREALDGLDGEVARKRLDKVVQTKYRSLSGDPQWRLKLLRFILGRGYSYDEAKAAVEQLVRGED